MKFTKQQIENIAYDTKSLSLAYSLSHMRSWSNLGTNESKLWGVCQGSKKYLVESSYDLNNYSCSCPSYKQPCKHVLGLLLLAIGNANCFSRKVEPSWVDKEESSLQSKIITVVSNQNIKNEKDVRLVEGMKQFLLWLQDLIRGGLMSQQVQHIEFWEQQADRLVDCGAINLSANIRYLGTLPGRYKTWPEIVLDELGKMALLIHSYQNLKQLPVLVQEDVKQTIKWDHSYAKWEQGESIKDIWLVVGRNYNTVDRSKVEFFWVWGQETNRFANIIKWASSNKNYSVGDIIEGELLYYPSNSPILGKFKSEKTQHKFSIENLSFFSTLEDFLYSTASILGKNPWVKRFFCPLKNTRAFRQDGKVFICDENRQYIPLYGCNSDRVFASSIGKLVNVVGEWNGQFLLPMGIFSDQEYIIF
ncbi:SWIM zinc finger domain-containing protein [Candidatus Uabimicrobium sp. HlEnr_7]|uniref:SWIM zinc finger family protein n=1 Tax=Candidatus Uabimicrobium helgolandensis TaxID=3095367 RepID=UPI0035567527